LLLSADPLTACSTAAAARRRFLLLSVADAGDRKIADS
jgi:hypothetical protein